MSSKALEALKIIVDKAIQTKDGYVVSCELNVKHQDELEEIGNELKRTGCISRVEYFGWNKIRCQVDYGIALSYLE